MLQMRGRSPGSATDMSVHNEMVWYGMITLFKHGISFRYITFK